MHHLIHIVSVAKWRDHSSVMYKRQSAFDIIKHQTATFMCMFINNQLLPNSNMYFKQNEQIQDHEARKKVISVLFVTSPLCALTIRVHGPRL